MTLLLAVLLLTQKVAPLQPATTLPPEGRAYVTSAPNDPSWLVLVTQQGRWVVQLDCGAGVIPPASDVQVTAQDDITVVQPMMLDDSGAFVPDPSQVCQVQQALYGGDTPCAELDGVCTVAAESLT